MENSADDSYTFVLHTERIEISGGRYLIYYTFSRPSETSDETSTSTQKDAQ